MDRPTYRMPFDGSTRVPSAPMAARKRLGEMLVDAKVITPQQLQLALQAQLIYGGRLGTNLVELDYITERFLARFLSHELNIPAATDAEIASPPIGALQSVSAEQAKKYGVIPISRNKNVLEVAMIEPSDLRALDELAFQTGLQIKPKVATELMVLSALERLYGIERKNRYIRLAGDRRPDSDGDDVPLRQGVTAENSVSDLPDLTRELSVHVPTLSPLPPQATIAETVQRIAAADSPEAVLDAVMAVWDPHFDGKILVFAATGGTALEIVLATGPLDFRARARGLQIPAADGNVLQLVVQSQSALAGIAASTPANEAMFAAIDDDPSTPILVMPLVVAGKVACVFLGLGPRASLDEATIRLFGIYLDKAAIQMEILQLRRRLLRLPEDV